MRTGRGVLVLNRRIPVFIPRDLHQRRAAWYRDVCVRLFREKPLGAFGAVLVLTFALSAVLADLIAPYGYNETHLADRLKPPDWYGKYPLGTDMLGRDILSRIIYGARISMYVGLGAVGLGTTLAVLLGLASAYIGGKVDIGVQRLVDAWMSFPWLVILLTIMSILKPGLFSVIIALGIGQTFGNSRIIRGSVLSALESQHVEAARATGCGHLRIIAVHVLPNIMAPIIIIASLGLGAAILVESALSFLGYGIPPPHPSWGSMLSGSARTYLETAPWMAVWPGLAISGAVFGFNMLGDALRDLVDPRLRGAQGKMEGWQRR
jgi:peptide/nickel transport system permease protein